MVRDIGSESQVTDDDFGAADDGESQWIKCLFDLSYSQQDEGIGSPGMGNQSCGDKGDSTERKVEVYTDVAKEYFTLSQIEDRQYLEGDKTFGEAYGGVCRVAGGAL